MRKLIVSVLSYPPFVTIENNKIGGIFGASYRYRLFSILNKMNYTLVPRDISNPAYCPKENVCFGDLRQLQLGTTDFAGFFSQFQISSSIVNLTIGPTVIEDQCSIIYSPTIRINKSVQAMITSFSQTFWFLILFFILLFAFPQTLLALNRKKISPIFSYKYLNLLFGKFIETLYSLFQQLIKQNFPPTQFNRLCLLSFLLYTLLVHLILSAAIQNGIYVSSTFDQLDTLDDVASHGYSVSLIIGPCNDVIRASQGSILGSHGLTSSLHSLRDVDKFQAAAFFAQKERVIVTEKYNMIRAQILVYQQPINGTKGRRMYKSAEPVFSLLQFAVFPRFLEPDIAKRLIRNGYSSFETGNLENYRLHLHDLVALSDGPLCSECLEPLRKTKEAMTISIPFNHAELMLLDLAIASAIGFIVFLIELLFKP